jgi:hypothetical protein
MIDAIIRFKPVIDRQVSLKSNGLERHDHYRIVVAYRVLGAGQLASPSRQGCDLVRGDGCKSRAYQHTRKKARGSSKHLKNMNKIIDDAV